MNFKDKVVLVTGSSRGIGRSIAVKFAKEGANVIINYKTNTKEAEAITEIISNYGNKCLCIQADISKENEVSVMIEKIIKEFGKIDIVINNAGIAIDIDFDYRGVKDWQDTLNTNLIGVFLISKYAGSYMRKNKYGKIINISSTNGIDTLYPYSIDYDASKAGLINLSTHTAFVYANKKIRCNCLNPGGVSTEIRTDNPNTFGMERAFAGLNLMTRVGEADELASAIVFLASDEASYVNGAVLTVDGGWTAY
mgnify:CR=1 FL=1